ncbi:MAG: hypothetical protein ACSHX8_04635 [Opitutaceae bacterium]
MRLLVPLSLFLASSLPVAALSVVNHSFEDISGEFVVNEFTFGPLLGWDLYEETPDLTDGGDGPDFFIGTLTPQLNGDTPEDPDDYIYFLAGAADGVRVGIAFNYDITRDSGEYGLQQTTTHTYEANTAYTLQVEIGNIASGLAVSNTYFYLEGFPGYRIALMADGVEIETDSSSAGSIAEGDFATATLTYVTGSSGGVVGQTIGIRLVNLNDSNSDTDVPAGNDVEVDFDDVRLDAVPLSPLEAWRFDHFGTTESTGNAANDFDNDLDGVANLIEFLLGLDPTVYDSDGAVIADITDVSGMDYLTLTFDRDLTASGVNLSVRATSDLELDLSSWDMIDPDGVNQVSSNTVGNVETLTVRDNQPTSGAIRRFMLLEVTEP